jgi:hypothetical protein
LPNPKPIHPPPDFFFLDFFLVRFWAFLGEGSSKTPQTTKMFLQKVNVENFSQNNRNFFDVSFSSTFLFYRVFGCFSTIGVQKHYKKRFTKKIVSKSFYKKFDQNSQTDFFSIVLSRFWAFLGEGSSKTTTKKIPKKYLTLVLFGL